SVFEHKVVQDNDTVRIWFGIGVVGRTCPGSKVHYHDAGIVVSAYNIIFDDYIIGRHDQDSRSRGNSGHDGSRGPKILMIVVYHKIIPDNNIKCGLDGQSGGNKGQDTPCIVMYIVVLYQCMSGILDLDTGNTVKDLVVHYIDMVAHAHIYCGILDPAQYVVGYQAVCAILGEYTIDAGIHDPVVFKDKIVPRLSHYPISFIVYDLKVFDLDPISGI